MAPSLPPNTRPVAPRPLPAPPVMSAQEWEKALKVQRMSQLMPNHVGSGFGGLELRPRNVHFATQNKGEKVFILLRRHFITNFSWFVSNIFYMLSPPIAYVIVHLFDQSVTDFVSLKVITLLIVIYYSLVFTNVLRQFVDWYFNIYIVTDERVINYSFTPFVSREITELNLQDIEDIKEEDIGILASFFNYGNLSVFTAADQSVIKFHYIPNPALVRDKISDLSKIVKSMRNES